MGSVDSVPVVAQVKCAVQYVHGEHEAASETNKNFSERCIGVSQANALLNHLQGNEERALEIQASFIEDITSFIDGLPIIGPTKSFVEWTLGSDDALPRMCENGLRTTAMASGQAIGFVSGGPGGAYVGGVLAGLAVDTTFTYVTSEFHNSYEPHGLWQHFEPIGHGNSGSCVDLAVGLAASNPVFSRLGRGSMGHVQVTGDDHNYLQSMESGAEPDLPTPRRYSKPGDQAGAVPSYRSVPAPLDELPAYSPALDETTHAFPEPPPFTLRKKTAACC